MAVSIQVSAALCRISVFLIVAASGHSLSINGCKHGSIKRWTGPV